MKRSISCFLVLSMLVASAPLSAQQKTNASSKPKTATAKSNVAATTGFVITGKITGLKDKSLVSLTDINNPTDTLAKARVTGGAFALKGKIAEPNLYQVNYHDAQKKSVLFLGNEQVALKGDVVNIQDIKATGSKMNDDFMDFQGVFNPLFKRLTELNTKVASNPSIDRNDTVMVAYSAQFAKIQTAIDKFLDEKKFSPVSAFMLVVTSELEQDFSVLEKRYTSLEPSFKNGFYGKIAKQQIDEARVGAIGSEAIAFTQNDTTGKPVTLDSFKGKYVLIDFWASWCRPCRMENPNVVNAFNKFKNKNFTVLGVSLDRAREPWIEAINADHLAWTQVSDLKFWQNEVALKYKVQGIPQNFLVGPDGKIVGKNLRGADLENKLCELLGCN